MEGFRSFEDHVAARNLLKADLEKSTTLSNRNRGSGLFFSLNGHINHAIAPAAAVFNVFNAICKLEKSLSSDPCSDLTAYLLVIEQLEQELMFLTGNCSLAIKWLEELLLFLEENGISHDRCTSNVNKALKILRELKATEELAHQTTGLLGMAFDKLESEFRRLLTDAISLALVSSSTNEGQACSAASLSLPASVIKKLQTIANRISANNRIKNCMSIYVEVRSFIVRECFLALEAKKNAVELPKLLDVFNCLNRLRLEFNRIFGGKSCIETEDLIKDLFKRMGESWGKVSELLRLQVVDLFSGGRATTNEHVKQMLKAINDVFDDMNKKKSNWVIWDEGFRQKIAQLVIQVVVPTYKSFIESYGSLGAEHGTLNKHFRYIKENLENSVSLLHRPKLGPSQRTEHMPSYITKSHQFAPQENSVSKAKIRDGITTD
ncbi:Exocyst complex subunit Exo70, C-terminal [Dillenia turbinata]|uniref:Exocyst subunit Exo70 family protein n=1 Tax=Dillenia turbinata TaxID=194707 RepID=A0AAN8ULC8_9MAGN